MTPLSTIVRVCGLSALTVLGTACAGGTASAPRTQVRLAPLPEAQQESALPTPPPLPDLPATGHIAQSATAAPRVASVTAVNQDVAVVIRELATKFGLQYQIDPGVRGVVNTTFRNRTLNQALEAIVPEGVTYQVQGGVLRVGPARMTTRIFSLDYVALSRLGTAATVIQRRLSGGSNGSAGIGGIGTTSGMVAGIGASGISGLGIGADVISAVSIADAWEEIRVATEALVFDAPAGGGQTQASPTGMPGLGGMGSTGRPFSRVSPEGRRLIINPMAGTITVSAFPAQLDQIETFIRAFESSIQRQVLIEAKIVEVSLDRSFQFGIDWTVVADVGNVNLITRSALPASQNPAGNIELTLKGGADRITAVLNALSSQGDVHVLSSPRVSALNNQRAVFDVTTGEIVFTVNQFAIPNAVPGGTLQFISQVTPSQVNVGIVLDVLPQIGADNVVTMNIRPVVTSVSRTVEFVGPDNTVFEAPVIETRESDTMARLRAGETIIIGGLMQTRREKLRSGIPVLRDIPLLGILFTRYEDVERKAELVIFLTPTIIAGQPTTAR
jgi:MSHA biogenesis protein MshL